MSHRFRTCSALGALLVGGATILSAQTVTTGGLTGTVVAPDGKPLADARITITSSQIVRTTMTDKAGKFQIGLLNPGIWKLTADAKGFQAAPITVSVAANANSPVHLRMSDIASATVAVVATGSEITIDNTTTAVGVNVTNEVFSKLPLGRNMNDLVYLAPSSNYGGAMSEGQGLDYSISGGSGAENQFVVDGLTTNDPRYGGQGTELVTDFIDSVKVETGGFKPEYSALGGVFSAITKSGSNTIQASAWATFSPASLEAKAKVGVAGFRQQAPADRYDLGFDLSGPILKDRLFYYVGADFNYLTLKPYPNASEIQSPDQKTASTQGILKLNWFITQDQQLTASFIATHRNADAPGAVPAGYGNANFGATRKYDTTNLSLIYDWTVSPTVLVSLKAGSSDIKNTVNPNDTTSPFIADNYWFAGGGGGNNPALSSFEYDRGGYGNYANEKGTTKQYKADLSWFIGDHALKVGFETMKSTYFRQDFASGSGDNLSWTILDNSTIISTLYGNIGGAEVSAKTTALFIQDSWEITKGFRLFYGFRGETQEQFGADGRAFLRFTNMGDYLQPRLGFTWDVNNDGKTKISGSYACYYEILPQRMGIREFASQKFLNTYYNFTYSPTGLGTIGTPTGTVHDYGGFFDSPPVANGIKLPKRQEYTIGLEHALPNSYVLTANGTYRHLTDPIEDSTIVDATGAGYMNLPEGALGLIWNPGPTVSWVAKPGTVGPDGSTPVGGQTITVNNTFFPVAYNKFLSMSLGLKHQTSDSFWSATYTWSHLYGNYEGVIAPDYGGGGQPDGNITASWDFWPYLGTGNLGLDRRHTFKFFGTQRLKAFGQAFNVGGKWTWQTGTPINLIDDGSSTRGLAPGTLTANGDSSLDPGYYGNSTFDHGLLGNHGRTPTVSLVDLHVDTEFAAGRVKISPAFDMFNAFNSRTATSVWQYATKATGAPDPVRYGQPQEWLQGRRFQFSLKVHF